jgi:hypothetical protein
MVDPFELEDRVEKLLHARLAQSVERETLTSTRSQGCGFDPRIGLFLYKFDCERLRGFLFVLIYIVMKPLQALSRLPTRLVPRPQDTEKLIARGQRCVAPLLRPIRLFAD